MRLDQLKDELKYFARGVLRLNPGARPRDIARAELLLGVEFPPSFRRFLAEFNGGHLLDEPLTGVPPIHTALDLLRETRQARTYWGPMGWTEGFIAVSNDGCGNPFALLLDRKDERGESPVGFFDAGMMQVTEIVASDYLHFVWFLIQDVKWDHTREGRPIPREAIRWTPDQVVVRPQALSPWRFNEAWMIAHDPSLARWR